MFHVMGDVRLKDVRKLASLADEYVTTKSKLLGFYLMWIPKGLDLIPGNKLTCTETFFVLVGGNILSLKFHM